MPICPQCAADLEPGSSKCPKCSTDLSAAAQDLPRPLPIIVASALLLVLAPGLVRVGPPSREAAAHSREASCWQALADKVDPANSVVLPAAEAFFAADQHPCTTAAKVLAPDEAERTKGDIERRYERLKPALNADSYEAMKEARELPEVKSWSVIFDEAKRAKGRVDYDTRLMAIGAVGALLCVALGTFLAGMLARRVRRLDGGALVKMKGAARAASLASAGAALAAVAWLVINAAWLPDFAVFASVGALFGAAPLGLVAKRLRRGQAAPPAAPNPRRWREWHTLIVCLAVGATVMPVLISAVFDTRDVVTAVVGFYNDFGYALLNPVSQMPVLFLSLLIIVGPYPAFVVGRKIKRAFGGT